MADPDLSAFATDLRQQVLLEADLEGDEALLPDAFTRLILDELEEAGEIEEGRACYHRDRGIEVSGYGVDDEGEVVDLFTTIYRGEDQPTSVTNQDADIAFRRLLNFWTKASDSYHVGLEESSEVFDMALRLHEVRSTAAKVRLFLLTDGISKTEFRSSEDVEGAQLSFHIWDVRRLHRLVTSGQGREPIEIDFVSRFGAAIPCLHAPGVGADYTAYLAIFPGAVLNEIYAQFGSRLLELNVRSFLQARGKVNQGIRRTILDAPERFLAYNNGISATASEIELVVLPGGGTGIRSVKDLQIVNGGQTTASLHHAVRRDGADVSHVFVPAKLTILGAERLAEIVPLIARYANSQNKINEADFSANDPFHVRIEELSRTTWAPATGGTQRQTRWFYERARGQYADALGREATPARQRKFKQEHPTNQRFTKTDLAKFENTWDQLPHVVSRGAQKNFAEFALRLTSRGKIVPDPIYFQHLVAKAILFRQTEKLVSAQDFGGYRANIVTYTLAYLGHWTAHRIDLERIWRDQAISPTLVDAIVAVSVDVHRLLTTPPGGANVTEWAKRGGCWDRVQDLKMEMSPELESQLIPLDASRKVRPVSGIEAPDESERGLIAEIGAVSAETWFELSHWAKETGNLASWQRSIAFDLGKRGKQGRAPSLKQAVQAAKILAEAKRLGYRGA
jgi:AIPR protein